MSRSPRITGSELLAALTRAGFTVVRIKVSHQFLRHEDGRITVVPIHSGDILGQGLLHKALRDCKMNVEDLRRLLRAG